MHCSQMRNNEPQCHSSRKRTKTFTVFIFFFFRFLKYEGGSMWIQYKSFNIPILLALQVVVPFGFYLLSDGYFINKRKYLQPHTLWRTQNVYQFHRFSSFLSFRVLHVSAMEICYSTRLLNLFLMKLDAKKALKRIKRILLKSPLLHCVVN